MKETAAKDAADAKAAADAKSAKAPAAEWSYQITIFKKWTWTY